MDIFMYAQTDEAGDVEVGIYATWVHDDDMLERMVQEAPKHFPDTIYFTMTVAL
jgi:hypothetical protein